MQQLFKTLRKFETAGENYVEKSQLLQTIYCRMQPCLHILSVMLPEIGPVLTIIVYNTDYSNTRTRDEPTNIFQSSMSIPNKNGEDGAII